MDNCEVLSCFDSFIGIKGCQNETTCKHLVNNLPGISNELLDKIADGDQETYFDVFTKAKRTAINSLKDDVLEVLLRDKVRYNFENTLFQSETARIIKPTESIEFTDDYIGILLTTADSKYILAQVNSISIYPTATSSVYAKIVDYESGETLFNSGETAIELVENEINVIEFGGLNIDCSNHRALMIVLQRAGASPNLELSKLSCNRFQENDCKSCDPCDCLDSTGNAVLSPIPYDLLGLDQVNEFAVYPYSSESETDLSLATPIENFICVDLELLCSIDQFICQNAKRLSSALVYKIGANLLEEKRGSHRVNLFAKGGLEFTMEKIDDFKKDYQKRIDKMIPTLPLSGDSMCWVCEKEVGVYVSSLI